MKLKMSEDGKFAEVQDGKPVYVHDDGKEIAFDTLATMQTLNRTLDECKKHKERAQGVEIKIKQWDEIGASPEEVKEALELKKNIKDGDLITAGKVKEFQAAAKKTAEEQVAAANKSAAEENAKLKAIIEQKDAQLDAHIIGGGFDRSKLITDPKHPMALIMTANVAKAYFGKNFRREDGKVVGYDNNGNKLFSRSKPGELADMDEAMEMLVAADSDRDNLLRPIGNKGDSARTSNGSATPKTMPQSEFNKLPPKERAARMAAGMTLIDA